MRTLNANNDLPSADAQRCAKLKSLMHRWRRALVDARDSLLSGDPSQRGDRPEPIVPDPSPSDGDTREPVLVPLPDERSQALAVLCDRLLNELDAAEVNAAEIRFVVHKNESQPRQGAESDPDIGDGELVWELRRLIAGSGGTIADVVRALEARGAELDVQGRDLLNDEVAALEVDIATLKLQLADPVDWDGELGSLLDGEVAPFDERGGEEDDEND